MIIPDGYAQINLKFLWPDSSQRAEVVFGVALDDVGLDPHTTAQAVQNAYGDAGLEQVQGEDISLDTILCKFGPNATGGSFELGVGQAGTLTGGLTTPQNSLLVSKVTLHGGRHGRGRSYWPGTQEGVWDNFGNLDAGARETFQSKFDDFVTALVSADIPMYLLHGDDVTTPFAVTSLLVQPLIATQRRRLGR